MQVSEAVRALLPEVEYNAQARILILRSAQGGRKQRRLPGAVPFLRTFPTLNTYPYPTLTPFFSLAGRSGGALRCLAAEKQVMLTGRAEDMTDSSCSSSLSVSQRLCNSFVSGVYIWAHWRGLQQTTSTLRYMKNKAQ